MTLDEIPSGTTVFADATVFIYHFAGASHACRRFLERCEKRDLKALTSAAALAEVTHRLMMMEAVSTGLASRGNLAKKLRDQPGSSRNFEPTERTSKRSP